jgi:hypothetical protein
MAADDGILGLLGRMDDPAALYEGALTDPATRQAMAGRGLLAMAGSFADSAMPTRMPTPFGAVLGHAASAAGTSDDATMAARLQAAQGKQALGIAALTQNKADLIKTIGPDQAAFDRMDSGGGIASAPPPGSVPGTLGSPAAATGSVNTGRGPDGVIIPPGTPTATHDPKLSGTDNLGNLARAAAPIALPPGYTMEVVSGNRPGATVAGTGGPSQHANANAIDIRIKRPDGSEVKNDGPDTEGVYGKVAVVMRAIADPSIKPWLAWGGNFGKSDIMHFDYAGDRGTAGSLAAMEKNLLAPPKPVQVAQANTGTMNDAVPPGMAAATARPQAPPGLLGPSGQTIPQLADQAMAARPPAPPGLLNAPPPGAAPAPISPETIATLKAGGATDAEIARIVAAPSAGAAVAPPGPQVAASGPPPQIPAGQPQSLIPPPPQAAQAAPVPPITQPQVAAAPPSAAASTAAIPGAPSPSKIAAAQRLAWKYTMAGMAVPADVEATAKFGLDVAKAGATAAATAPTEISKAIAIATGQSALDVQKAIDIAKGTLGPELTKARAGPAESGAQARQTAAEAYGNEIVLVPGQGYMQRRNIPGYVPPGGTAAAAPGRVQPGSAAAPGTAGPGASATGTPPSAPAVLYPERTPEQETLQKGLGEVQRDEYKTVVTEAATAENAKSYLLAIQQALQTFNNPGATAETKLNMAKMLQSALSTAGVKVPDTLNEWIAAGEVTAKAGTKLGFELSRTLGAHEAEGIVNQAVRNNPGLATSLDGNKQLIGLMGAIIDRSGAKRQFFDDWLDPKKGAHSSLAGAATEFNRQNPQEVMVSQFAPYIADQLGHDDASRRAAYDKLPPGVKIKDLKTGKEFIKPAPGGQ